MKFLTILIIGICISTAAGAQGCITHYVDPTFQLTKTEPTCKAASGILEVINQQGGVPPFVYRLIETNTTNTTGLFPGLPAGTYTVSSTDACGTIRTRQATLSVYSFDYTFSITKLAGCDGGQIVIEARPAGTYEYAVVAGTDTTRSINPTFTFPHVPRQLQVIVTDECGNTLIKSWTSYTGFLPYISEIQHNLQCGQFDLFVIANGFTSPTFCMYHANGTLVNCQSTPNFFNVPYGDYYFIVSDACYRDSMYQPNMESSGGSQLDPYNWDCTDFTMHVDGMKDTVCLYNAITNQLVSCRGQDVTSLNPRTGSPWPSGAVWEHLPYGSYYAYIFDPCTDSTFRIDSTVRYPFKIAIASRPMCSLTETLVYVNFDYAAKKPYTVKVYYPDSTLATLWTTNSADSYIPVPRYSGGGLLMVVASDACGITDTAYVQQEILELNKNIEVINNCPGLIGTGGSGTVKVRTMMQYGIIATPEIIAMDGHPVTIAPNSTTTTLSWNRFDFTNLQTGVYIIKYNISSCGQMNVYDTVVINDYIYPVPDSVHVYECLNNPFTFTTSVIGGLSPYTYQIIGSTPSAPSLVTPLQSTPAFTVDNGNAYSLVTVRTIDQCGNSTINDVQVIPTDNCDRVLVVDTIANQSLLNSKSVKIYPNPSTGHFIVAFNQKKKTDYKIEVINIAGIRLYSQTVTGIDKKDCTVGGSFTPGLYFITVTNVRTGESSTFKQIIH